MNRTRGHDEVIGNKVLVVCSKLLLAQLAVAAITAIFSHQDLGWSQASAKLSKSQSKLLGCSAAK